MSHCHKWPSPGETCYRAGGSLSQPSTSTCSTHSTLNKTSLALHNLSNVVSAQHNLVIKASDRSEDPVSLHAWSGTWHWGWEGVDMNHTSLSISLHLDKKTASSGGWRSLFHPRVTRLSLDSLILICWFPFYACLPPFDSPCLVEFMSGSCSQRSSTSRDKSRRQASLYHWEKQTKTHKQSKE